MSAARRAGFLGDSRALSITALLLAVAVSAALFAVSYQGLAYAGEAIGLASASWIVPVALDGGILVAGLLAAVRRGQKRSSRLEVSILWLSTIASSAANVAAHASKGDGWLAIGVASIAPWFFLALTESIIRTVVQDEVAEKRPKRTPRASVAAPSTVTTVQPTVTVKPIESAAPARGSTPRPLVAVEPSGTLDDLLARFDALAADPRTSEARTDESAEFTAVIRDLVDGHGQGPTALARRAGHANADRIKDRLRRARKNAVADAA